MRQRPKALLAALVVAIASFSVSTALSAQSSTLVTGQVVDQAGDPVAGAHVSTPTTSTVTDAQGRFVIATSPSGDATLRIERARFRRTDVPLGADRTSAIRVMLEIAPVSEQVRVVPPVVDATTFDAYASTQTIVSAAQIESLNALDLASALRRTPGVTISRFNPVGAFGGAEGGSVHVRGIGASRPGSEIKTYVDGVPFYMGLWNHPLLDLLPVTGIDRITVLKGPQPQAFGNTFSAIDLGAGRARAAGLDGLLRVSGGSFGTVAQQAFAAGRVGAWELVASQGFARSDGHRDDAGGRLANGSLRVGYRWGDRWNLDGSVLHADNVASDPGEAGRPETRTGRYETSGTLLALAMTHEHDAAHGTLQIYRNQGAGDWLGQRPPDGDTLTQFALSGLRWREQVRFWNGGTLTGGLTVDRVDGNAQFLREAPAPPAAFDGEPFTITSPHVAVDHTFALRHGWTISPSAGLRHYRHSQFEQETAPHAGVVIRGARPFALRANYARGVNYPGQEVAVLSMLIPPLADTWRQIGAESLDHVELGATVAPTAATTIDVAWFTDRLRNRYVFAFPPAAPRPAFLNLGDYTVRGGELSVQQRVAAQWQVFGGLTLLDASRAQVPYTPETTLVLGLTGTAGRFRLAVDAQAQAGMYVFGRGRTPVPADLAQVDGFTVVNVRPSYRLAAFGDAVEVFAAIENLFDEAYAYRPGYPMPGTSLQVGVTIRRAGR